MLQELTLPSWKYLGAPSSLVGTIGNFYAQEERCFSMGTIVSPWFGSTSGFFQGFMIALFNPKILAWMLALYAPFIEADVSIETLLGMGALGMGIDGTWYVTVATILSSGNGVDRLRSNAHLIDGCMGILMFVFAGLLASGWL